jgi:YbbR domain-containing protein
MADYKKILARAVEKWPAKVLSIVAAIFLFAFNRMNDLQERFFSVPLHLDIAADLIPSSAYPRNVRITMRGPNSIYHITETDIEARLDCTRITEPGLYRVPVQIQRKGAAAETEILEIITDPAELSLELDTKMTRNVSLTPSFQGYLEPGYEMVSFTLEPNQAVIDGPAKLMSGISELSTDFIDLRGRSADFSARVRIVNPNPFLSVRGDGTAEFRGFIKELIVIKTIEKFPVGVRGLAETFEAALNPPEALVRIHGIQSVLDGLTPGSRALVLSVDCSGVNGAGVYELPLLAATEEGLSVERLEPERITVEIRLKENR